MNSRTDPPERLVAAVDCLDVQPEDRILEIGCGRGVAADLVCGRLAGGRLDAVDRSAKAVAAATARNAAAVACGKARFLTEAIEDVDAADLYRYDKVFAVNVNLFWVRPAQQELRLIAGLLRPGGRLWLCYDPPDSAKLARMRTTLGEHLAKAGYAWTAATLEAGRSTLLVMTARPHAGAAG